MSNTTPATRNRSTPSRAHTTPRYAGPARYGYPKFQPSRLETVEAELEELRRRLEHLELCHACIDGSHEVPR